MRPLVTPPDARAGPHRGQRVLIAVIMAVLALFSLTHTVSNVLSRSSPELAYRLAPWDGRNAALLSSVIFASTGDKSPNSDAGRLATKALQSDATVVKAVVVKALQAALRGDLDTSRKDFLAANTLSRREFQTHLWAIEQAVNGGDYRGALQAYDVAMRSSGYAQEILFPILANAMSEPVLRKEVISMMRMGVSWKTDFIHYAAVTAPVARPASLLLRELPGNGIAVAREDESALIESLAAQKAYADAWGFAETTGLAKGRDGSRDPNLRGPVVSPGTVFDWRLPESGGISLSFASGPGSPAEFAVSAGFDGAIARQVMVARPGNYRLTGRISLTSAEEKTLEVSVGCEGAAKLVSVILPAGAKGTDEFSREFTVPTGCDAQRLEIAALQRNSNAEISGTIHSLQIAPANLN